MKSTKLIIWVVVTILVGAGAFYGGMKYGQNKRLGRVPNFSGAPAGPVGNGSGNANRGNGMASGEIISKDDTSMTIKTQNGSTRVVYFSGATSVAKSTEGAIRDLATGSQVTASGTSNSDNSITATEIQIR